MRDGQRSSEFWVLGNSEQDGLERRDKRDGRDTGGSSEFAVLVRREAKMATGLAGY